MDLIEDKDRQFHQHIKRNRVDPSLQSTTNPVPDFYGTCFSSGLGHYIVLTCFAGEKIGSMKEYRQWLRDQVRFTYVYAIGLVTYGLYRLDTGERRLGESCRLLFGTIRALVTRISYLCLAECITHLHTLEVKLKVISARMKRKRWNQVSILEHFQRILPEEILVIESILKGRVDGCLPDFLVPYLTA